MTEPTTAWIRTERETRFVCHPRTTDDAFDTFFDALPEHYWDGWRPRVFGTLSIAFRDRVVHVSGWPWWVPAWCARRSLGSVAAASGVNGAVVFVVERAVAR